MVLAEPGPRQDAYGSASPCSHLTWVLHRERSAGPPSSRPIHAHRTLDPLVGTRPELSCCCIMTLEEDRADIERIAVGRQDAPKQEPEAMVAKLDTMLEYLDPSEDAQRQLRQDASRLLRTTEQSPGRTR